MFAKLKKRLAEEEGVHEEELTKKVAPGSAQRRTSKDNSRTNDETSPGMSPWGSSSSLNASGAYATPPSKLDDVDSGRKPISKKDEQIKRLEEKLDQYSIHLKSAVKAKEKLEIALEKQEEVTNKKIQDMNEQYQMKRAKMAEKLSIAIKKKEQEIIDRMEQLEKENADLQVQLQRQELTRFKKQEDEEDLQGFQVQELAKVKHMLLIGQEELQKLKAELQNSRELVEEQSGHIERLTAELNEAKETKTEISSQRDELLRSRGDSTDILAKLERDKKLLSDQCSRLTTEKNENLERISSLEEKLQAVQEDLGAVRHKNESIKLKVVKELESKHGTILQLQEKLGTMEQRLQDNSLSEDEKVTSITAERDTLEKKLEDARKQLTDLKVSSNDQVSGLEKQISHLNAKMTDDQEEQGRMRQELEAASKKHRDEMEEVEARMTDLQSQVEQSLKRIKEQDAELLSRKAANEKQITTFQAQLQQARKQASDQKQQLQEKVTGLYAKIVQLETARDFDKSAAEHRISRLESVNEESLDKEIEHEKHITNLEEEKDSIKRQYAQQERATLKVQIELEQTKLQIIELEDKVSEAEALAKRSEDAKIRIQEELSSKESLHKSQNEGYSTMASRIADIQIELEEVQKQREIALSDAQRSLSEKDGALGVLRESLAQKEDSCRKQEEQIRQLDERLTKMSHDLESHQNGSQKLNQSIEQLSGNVQDLEQQLAEKNKTIKMQQQRLTDLKKTLQRELKIQSTAGYESAEESLKRSESQERIPLLVPSTIREPTVPAAKPNHSFAPSHITNNLSISPLDGREINFQYLRHVVFKFMCSPHHESIQLLKAVSTVLEFTPQEERSIKEMVEWKSSWFASKPSSKKNYIQLHAPTLGYR